MPGETPIEPFSVSVRDNADVCGLALSDFDYFANEWPLDLKAYPFQHEWRDAIQDFLESEEYEGLLILGPPDHGKTERVVIPLILWLLARDHNTRIILASGKDEFAAQIAAPVKTLIETDTKLQKDFGLMVGRKWAETWMQLARSNTLLKDASLLCIGTGSEILSTRADFIIGDDILTPKNSATAGQRTALRTWFRTQLRSRRTRQGKYIFMAHRVHPEDLYQELKHDSKWKVLEYPAIINDSTQEILCPELHTYKELDEMRNDDPVGFALFYAHQAVAFGTYINRKMLDPVLDRSRTFIGTLYPDIRAMYQTISVSLDPAFGVSRFAKYSVIEVWGITPGRRRDLLWAWRGRVLPEVMEEMTKAALRRFMPDKAFIEANAAQSVIITHMRREVPELANKINPVYTEDPRGKGRLGEEMSKMFQIAATPTLFSLPYGDDECRNFVDQFIEELVGFPELKYRDCIMSWYINEHGLRIIDSKERTGFIRKRGVVGSVSHAVRLRHKRGMSPVQPVAH